MPIIVRRGGVRRFVQQPAQRREVPFRRGDVHGLVAPITSTAFVRSRYHQPIAALRASTADAFLLEFHFRYVLASSRYHQLDAALYSRCNPSGIP